jgi:hypothetical protein
VIFISKNCTLLLPNLLLYLEYWYVLGFGISLYFTGSLTLWFLGLIYYGDLINEPNLKFTYDNLIHESSIKFSFPSTPSLFYIYFSNYIACLPSSLLKQTMHEVDPRYCKIYV